MSLFPATIQAGLGGATVRASILILLDFVTTPMRLWSGAGYLSSGGYTWAGLGEVGSISGLDVALSGEAPETTFMLSGVDPEIVSLARDEWQDEAKDRLAQVLIQFHNDADNLPLELYDEPYSIWSGRMQSVRFELMGDQTRTISVSVESLFTLRSRPAYSQYTDSDQQARFAGDLGFAFVPSLLNKVVTWPDF